MTYMNAISTGFPTVQCYAVGDGSVYEDIVWEGGAPLPSKQTLDEWIAANPVSPSTKITVLSFRNRFTQTEKITIDLSSIDNPSTTIEQRQLSAMLRVMMADIATATFIDLARPDTRGSVQMLEQYGVIGQGRAAIILDTPPTSIELYKE